MITVLTVVDVAEGRGTEVMTMWRQLLDLARQHAGFHKATLLRDTTHAGHYAIHAEWETRTHFEDFVRTSGMTWLNRDLDLWHQTPITVYDEVVHVVLREDAPAADA